MIKVARGFHSLKERDKPSCTGRRAGESPKELATCFKLKSI